MQNLSNIDYNLFNKSQKNVLIAAKAAGLDIKYINNPNYSKDLMLEIIKILQNKKIKTKKLKEDKINLLIIEN